MAQLKLDTLPGFWEDLERIDGKRAELWQAGVLERLLDLSSHGLDESVRYVGRVVAPGTGPDAALFMLSWRRDGYRWPSLEVWFVTESSHCTFLAVHQSARRAGARSGKRLALERLRLRLPGAYVVDDRATRE